MIDLHTHVLPGIDDGARSLDDSRVLALEAAADGISALVATPHVREDYPTTADMMEDAVADVRADFAEQRIPVEVVHGAEIDLSLLWAIPPDDLRRLTIAQTGRYLLLEFPYRRWPLALDTSVKRLVGLGVTPVLAHPERNPEVQDRPDRVRGARRGRRARAGHRRLARGTCATARRRLPRSVCSSSASCTSSPATRTARTSAARGSARSPAASATRLWRAT